MDRLVLSQPLPGEICPGKGKCQQGDQFVNAFTFTQMRILETETSRLQAAKQSFYLPAVID
jgi:hypothetical protein